MKNTQNTCFNCDFTDRNGSSESYFSYNKLNEVIPKYETKFI